MKNQLKSLLKKIPLNFTKNQQYDAQTKRIFKKYLTSDSVFIDIGCHKGEVLDWAIKYSPNSKHIGFEAIPKLAKDLQSKYTSHTIYNLALSDSKGKTSFNYVTSNPAYSGIKKRDYVKEEEIEIIEVEMDCLDDVLSTNQKVSLIKIDVEGGELGVLNGANKTILREKPIIVFEHGLGASEFYDNSPEKMWDLLVDQLNYNIGLMKHFNIEKPISFSKREFLDQYYKSLNYYFVAFPKVVN